MPESSRPHSEEDLLIGLRGLLTDERCLCSSAHTDWRSVADLLDRLEAVQVLHRRRPHSANGGKPTSGLFDFVAHGQTEFPDLCDHCTTPWPCETARAFSSGQTGSTNV